MNKATSPSYNYKYSDEGKYQSTKLPCCEKNATTFIFLFFSSPITLFKSDKY